MIMIEKLWEAVKYKANVVGFSEVLRRRIKDGEEINSHYLVFRVYVSKKLPLTLLKLGDIVPKEIESIPTDVVEIGDPTAPPPGEELEYEFSDMKALVNRVTDRIRPLVAGVSIGNWSITVGSLGYFFKDGKGSEVLGSNGHVFAADPLSAGSLEKHIVQPGRYDGGTEADVVAEYLWHEPLGGSECIPSNFILRFLNAVYYGLGKKTRYALELSEPRKIDFGVAVPSVEFSQEIYGSLDFGGFVGLGFAGSDKVSFFCKARNILEAGWSPIDKAIQVVHVGNRIHKVGRTTGYTSGLILDDSATIRVAYSDFVSVEFEDIIMTDKMIEGGDSGSSAWRYINLAS